MRKDEFLERVRDLLKRVSLSCLEKKFDVLIKYDMTYHKFLSSFPVGAPRARVFIQLQYSSKCNKGGEQEEWRGRKWYLSEHMTDDEIVKTCYTAFKTCVEHEVMEGFQVDGKILFNPHLNFEELLKISDKEIKRN